MPFRLMNAPATLQWLMQSCLGNLHLQNCIIYLDVNIVFSKTLEEYLVRLRAVFEKTQEGQIEAQTIKMQTFQTRTDLFRPCCIQKWCTD